MILADNKSQRKSRSRSANADTRLGDRPIVKPDYFFIDEFSDPGAGETFMAVMPPAKESKQPTPPSGLPAYLAHLWSIPLLNQEQEQHCFRKLNYLKFLLADARERSDAFVSHREFREDVEALRASIDRTRNLLVESNLRLVVSIAKRYGSQARESFDELVCVGNEALMRSVDLFDFRRGIRFSTYAYQAIERSMFGLYRRSQRHSNRFLSVGEDTLQQFSGDAGASDRAELEADEAGKRVALLLEQLDDRDQHIVKARFGIGRAHSGVAFHVIAKEIQLSTTRTVQLFHRSMEKMRSM